MTQSDRDLLTSRVLAGFLGLSLSGTYPEGDGPFLLYGPDRAQRYLAEEAHREAHEEAVLDGLYREDELEARLRAEGGWDDEDASLLDRLVKDQENLKVKIFELAFRTTEQLLARKALKVAREEHARLFARRHARDHEGASGVAALARARCLVGLCLRHVNGQPVWEGASFWDSRSALVDDVVAAAESCRLNDGQCRELARTEPWRGYWAARKAGNGLFGKPSADLTDEQRQVVAWSMAFDGVYEHPDCPPEEVVADDDALDGWMILRRREREGNVARRRAESLLDQPGMKDAGEVFVLTDSEGGARSVDSLNDERGAAIKRQRLNVLAKQGVVEDQNMPDARLEQMLMANRAEAEVGRG